MKLLSLFRRPVPVALAAIGACLLHYQMTEPIYEGEAGLQVSASSPFLGDEEQNFPEAIPPEVLTLAMKSLDAQQTKAGAELFDVEKISQNTQVTLGELDNSIELHYLTNNQEEAILVLNTVSDAYIELSREIQSSEALPKLRELREQKSVLREKIETEQQNVAEISLDLKENQPSASDQAITLAKLEVFSAQLAEIKSKRLKAETRYREAVSELEAGTTVNLIASQLSAGPAKDIVQSVLNHAGLAEKLKKVRATKRNLLQIYGSRHPRIIEITARERDLSEQIESTGEGVSLIEPATAYTPARTDPKSLLLNSLERDLRRDQEEEMDLQEQLDLEQAHLTRQAELKDQLQQAQLAVVASQTQLHDISAKLEQTGKRHRAMASIITPAVISEDPVSPRLSHHLFWGVLSAAFLVVLVRWAFRDLDYEMAPVTPVASENEPQPLPPLHARRLMRLAKLKKKQAGSVD